MPTKELPMMEMLPQEAKQMIEEVPGLPELAEPPKNNVGRNAGIVVGVLILAAVFAKLYKCTAKKK
jgi:hypothetical protein